MGIEKLQRICNTFYDLELVCIYVVTSGQALNPVFTAQYNEVKMTCGVKMTCAGYGVCLNIAYVVIERERNQITLI